MIGWIGTITSILGSFLVAFHLFVIGYVLFLIGSFSWLIEGIKAKNKSLVTLNFTFFVANIIGIYKAL